MLARTVRTRRPKRVGCPGATLLAAALCLAALAGCGGGSGSSPTVIGGAPGSAGPAPPVAEGALDEETSDAASAVVDSALRGAVDEDALATIADTGDGRLGWILSDLLRFASPGGNEDAIVSSFEDLTDTGVRGDPDFASSPWLAVTNRMIAWDLPAPPGYQELKARLFSAIEPGWRPFFADADSAIDWRLVSWGGVPIDGRPLGDPDPCPTGCIPALDDPALTEAAGGDWYPDDATVFGVVVSGEAVALPKNVMEVHEMVNMTIGGRRLGIPYCTLCGSAQAYFTDSVPAGVETPVLRTSGLLSRSNKVMYDLNSKSVFDTFTGEALSGPLQDAGLTLRQTSVVASTWGAWKEAHPDTKIIAQDGGIGRAYPADPLGGRDDAGPIFPVGDVDPRLPVQEQVVGVISPGRGAVAFPVEAARETLDAGGEVALAGVRAVADGDGLRVLGRGGRELPSHPAFWFAWSQFHLGTALWVSPG